MTSMLEQLVEVTEAMLAYVADAFRPESFTGFPLVIAEVPADQRSTGSRVRLAYATMIDGGWVRLG